MKKIVFVLIIFCVFGLQAQEKTSPSSDNAVKKSDSAHKEHVNVEPKFPGGIQAFYTLVSKQFKAPKTEEKMVARILISFIVERDGSMSSFEILNDPGYGMGEQAVQILKSIKEKWSPGLKDGMPMRVSYKLPLTVNTTN